MAIEWTTTGDAQAEVRSPSGPHGHALVLGTDNGAVAVEGDLGELEQYARRLLGVVLRARDAMAYLHSPCTGAGDLCGAPAGTPCEPGCPSLATDPQRPPVSTSAQREVSADQAAHSAIGSDRARDRAWEDQVNQRAEFLPQLTEDELPAIRLPAGSADTSVLVFAYWRDGELVVSIDSGDAADEWIAVRVNVNDHNDAYRTVIAP